MEHRIGMTKDMRGSRNDRREKRVRGEEREESRR
jgi:hypothetical protein